MLTVLIPQSFPWTLLGLLLKSPLPWQATAAKGTLPGTASQTPAWRAVAEREAGLRGLSLACRPHPLPVSSLLLQHHPPCVLGPMPGGVDLLEASMVPVFAPLHTLPLQRKQKCPSFTPGYKNKGVPKTAIVWENQRDRIVEHLNSLRPGMGARDHSCVCKGA